MSCPADAVGAPVRQPGRTRPPVGFRPFGVAGSRSPTGGSWAYGPGVSFMSTPRGCGSSGCISSLGGCRRSSTCLRRSCGTGGCPPTSFGGDLVRPDPQQVGDVASATETLRILEEVLRSRLAEAPSRGLDLVQHAGGGLETSHGAVSVGALSDAAGVSSTHLATQFKSHVGVTPKKWLGSTASRS